MKRLLLLIIIFNISFLSYGQEIKIKNNVVSIDGKECLKIESSNTVVSFYNLEGDEIISMRYIHGSKFGKVYNKIIFLDQKLAFTSQSLIFSKKSLISKLIKSRALVDCKLVPDKVENFVLKYDEDIEKDVKIIIIEK